MTKIKLTMLALLLALPLLTGCAMVKTPSGDQYHTLGIATLEVTKHYEGREDGLTTETIELMTDAFSGWEAIIEGLGSAVVKIFTFGFGG